MDNKSNGDLELEMIINTGRKIEAKIDPADIYPEQYTPIIKHISDKKAAIGQM